ncbi:MAG: nitrilase [Alphaproteobacteria bacterium]|nr:nitrilase [Alphaproteobacteria bacterium]
MSRGKVTASVVQAGSFLFDTPRTMAKLHDLAADAARCGAQIAVFPEAFIGGYPKGAHFGAPVGSRSMEGRELFRLYADGAILVPGPEVDAIATLAGELKMDLVVGAIELDPVTRGTLYCTVLFFSGDGRFLGKRRKLMPTAAERVIWGQGDGSTLAVAQGLCGRIAGVICWENYMPALRMSQYAQGVDFYCAPTVDDRESWTSAMRMIALEGRCFVLSACQHLPTIAIPQEVLSMRIDPPPEVLIAGGSLIASPMGEILAGPARDCETILTAELDLDDITRARMDFDAAGHYARPDVFKLVVNDKVQAPTTLTST